MDQKGDGDARGRDLQPADNRRGGADGEVDNSGMPQPAEQRQLAAAQISVGLPPPVLYNQQIADRAAAVHAVAALAAIVDQASQQASQGSAGPPASQPSVASLVSTLSTQPQDSNPLGGGALAVQLGGILPMGLNALQRSNEGQRLPQHAGWLNPAMNAAASVPYAAGGAVAPTVFPAATLDTQGAPSDTAATAPDEGPTSEPPSSRAAAMAAPALAQRPSVPLFLDYDQEVLTEYQCLLRQQIELFEAAPEDIQDNVKGRIKQVRVNQLGIRCRHCSMVPPENRGRGAVYFAYSIEGIYQLAQNMGKKHLCDGCGEMPASLKHKIRQMLHSREKNNRRAGGKAYWVESLAVLGVYKEEATGMLRLKPPR